MKKLKKILFTITIIISINEVTLSQTETSLFFAEINFHLGQDKKEVLGKINLKKYELVEFKDDNYIITKDDPKTGFSDYLGSISFLNGKLSSASSHWVSSDSKETYESFESVFGILKKIFGEGYSACEIHVSSFENSVAEGKQIEIILGDKSANISITYSKKDSLEIVDVYEEILSR